MSNINPEVTNRLADWLVEKYGIEGAAWKIDYLFRRTDMGDGKYGRPLLPFDGRKTPIDRLEELSDEMQYTMKDIMEREAIADLLERAATNIDPHFGHTPEDVNGHPHPRTCQECTANLCDEDGEENWTDEQVEYWRSMNPIVIELRDMAAKLRADCERSVPVEAQTFHDDKKVVEYTWEQREALAARIAIRRSEGTS